MVNNSQKKVGYRDVVFNIKDNNLYEKTEGDNYKKLGTVGGSGDGSGDGGGTIQTTATLPLANPTRGSRADSTNLKTQADFNNYINESVREETTNRANADVELQVQITKLENKVDGIDGVDLEIPAWTQDEDTWVFPSEDVQFPQNVFCDGKFYGDGSKLTNLPEPVLEGALVFKGSVDTEASLPDSDNTVGDLWHTNDDDSLYAWGEDDAWHNVGSSTDINLDEYARLDGATFSSVGVGNDPSFYQGWYFTQNQLTLKKGGRQHILISPTYSKYYKTGITSPSIEFDHEEGTITANEFIGDGSKLTNLPIGGSDDPVDLDGYATEEWVEGKGYLTSIPKEIEVDKIEVEEELEIVDGDLVVDDGDIKIKVGDLKVQDGDLKVQSGDAQVSGKVTAASFEGDGSKLTNLPVGGADLSEYAKLSGADFTGACSVNYGFSGYDNDQWGYDIKLGNELAWYHAADSHSLTMDDYGLTIQEWELDEGNDAKKSYNKKVSIKEGAVYADQKLQVKPTDISKGKHYLKFDVDTWEGFKVAREGYDDQTFTIAQGVVTGKEFVGDGSKLENVAKLDGDGAQLTNYAAINFQNPAVVIGNSGIKSNQVECLAVQANVVTATEYHGLPTIDQLPKLSEA